MSEDEYKPPYPPGVSAQNEHERARMADHQIALFRGHPELPLDGRAPVEDTRPDHLEGRTYKLRLDLETERVNLYVTITNDHNGRPYEVFMNTSYGQLTDYCQTVAALVSRMLRYGVPPEVIAADLMEVVSPFTAHWQRGWHCPSLSHLLGRVLVAHTQGLTLDEVKPDG